MTPRMVATYDYCDSAGRLLYQNVRFDPKDFRQRVPHGTTWRWGRNGTPATLYRLPELLESPKQDWIIVTEGEKDCDAVRALGFPATTSGGATSWRAEFAEHFRGRLVAIIGDRDDAGRKFSRAAAKSLAGIAAEVRIITLPDGSKDISEWIENHDSLDEQQLAARIVAMIDGAKAEPAGKPAVERRDISLRIVALDAVTERETDWLWQGWIPFGALTIIGGNPGAGKSSLSLDIATRLSKAWPMPTGDRAGLRGITVIVGDEDSAGRVTRPRLRKMGADLSHVKILEGVTIGDDEQPFALDGGTEPLDLLMGLYPETRLIILDPITDYLGFAVNANSNAEVRRVLRPLNPWADRHNVAVVGITHLNKRKDDDAAFRVLGSMGFVAIARAVLGVSVHPEDIDRPAWEKRRIVTPIKQSYAPEGDAVVFRIDQAEQTVLWDPESLLMGANEALSGGTNGKPAGTTKAEAWLRTQLDNAQGPIEATTLKKRAEEYGTCSERALYRAAERIGVSKGSTGFGSDRKVWWGRPGMDVAAWLSKV